MIAIGVVYLLIESGLIVVNTEGTFLLLVLIFGAGTDYSLLLVHRYREQLELGVGTSAAPSPPRLASQLSSSASCSAPAE